MESDGLFEKFTPKFVKKYDNLSWEIVKALQNFRDDVEKGLFPGPEHTFHIKEEIFQEVLKQKEPK